ncbi:hypothetical protein QQP08_024838 [Theobroma cacao]|nr:hypothetical protein QQP08_024838 [Theobroma cacao]
MQLLSGLTRCEILERYQEHGDSVLGRNGNNRPNVQEVAEPLLNLFNSEPGNSLWKRKADSAFQHRTTMKSFFEERLVAMPDSVLDSPIAGVPSGREDLCANVQDLLPPPYDVREQEAVYA